MRNAPRKSKSLFVIYSTFFLLVSIPLVTWGVINGSFDIRNMAFDSVSVSDENPCVISLPNVNPYTLEVGKAITVQVDAKLKDAGIESLKISDSTGTLIHEETFDDSPITIATSFKFTPFKSGTVDMLGLITKVGGGSVACKISSEYDVLGLKAMASNKMPEFTSVPAGSKPSQDIKTDVIYEYTLTATDIDGDHINYSYSFTPGASWLKPTIIEDGSNGRLTIKFQGSTDQPASYLANIFIHDGYSKHLAAQAWVISVSPAENDIPIVRVISPVASTSVSKGQSTRISWEASDLNQITKYELYVSQNPADQESWTVVNNNISSKTTSYLIDTSNLKSGTYKAIVKATDNQNPALTGVGLSPEIVVTGTESAQDDDIVVLNDPQVINMSPNSTDTIQNQQVTIKATLIAGANANIDNDSIVVKLDDKDITSSISINKISSQEHTVIYQTEDNLETGIHKMEIFFEDSNGKSVTKSWTFTIQAETTTADGYVNIFGMEISQRTLIIVGVGILVVILAIVVPIIIFKVWKEEQYKKDEDPLDSNIIPNLPTEPVPAFVPTPTEVKNMVEAPVTPIVEEKPVEDAWDNYAAPIPQEQPDIIEPPIPVEEPKVEPLPEPEPIVEEKPEVVVEPKPVEEAPTETIPTPIAKEEVVVPAPIPTPEPIVEETPVENTTPTPPEPDLNVDLAPGEDLASIYEQIQQAEQEETPATKE